MRLIAIAILLTSCSPPKVETCKPGYKMPDGAICDTHIDGSYTAVMFRHCTSGLEYVNPPTFERVCK